MYLYDIHAHKLNNRSVGGYQTKCILNTSPSAYRLLANKNEGLFSCGIHPWDAGCMSGQQSLLNKVGCDEAIVAIGEAGLDKLKGAGMDIQMQVFRPQAELSMKLNKPLIIHCVKAFDELIGLYKEYNPSNAWILHGYRGSLEQAQQLSRLGFLFSLGNKFNESALIAIPLDSIFCETDTADVHIYDVYTRLADVLGLDISELVAIVSNNVKRTFFNMQEL